MDSSSFSNVHPHVEQALHGLFRRGCVECPPTTPSCPPCSGGKVCSLVPASCDSCAYTTCVQGDNGPSHSGPNVGAIAGGVVGGIIFVGLAVFLFYWFFIRHRRQRYEDEWEEEEVSDQKSNFNMHRSERASVHTVGSVANSILSRASNFIPIAYIPGVMTNRDGRGSAALVPPVPPIPAAHGQGVSGLSNNGVSGLSNNGEALFFRPGDLRDSTYSDVSSFDNRSTFAGRHSITPSLARSSIATYRDDAVVNPMPAQTVLRGKANVVSVKSGNSGTPGSTPPFTTPNEELSGLDFTTANTTTNNKRTNYVMPTSSDGINTSNSQQTLSSASFGKPTLLTLNKKGPKAKGRFPVAGPEMSSSVTKPNTSSPLANSGSSTLNSELSSPFADSAASTPPRTPGGLSAVMEESSIPSVPRLNTRLEPIQARGSSPFGDEHAA